MPFRTLPPPPPPYRSRRPPTGSGLIGQVGAKPTQSIGPASDGWAPYALILVVIVSLAFALPLAVAGCDVDGEVVRREDAGVVLDARDIPVAFNQAAKTRVECSNGTFIVVGNHSVMKGRSATLTTYSGGRRFLFVEGEPRGWVAY